MTEATIFFFAYYCQNGNKMIDLFLSSQFILHSNQYNALQKFPQMAFFLDIKVGKMVNEYNSLGHQHKEFGNNIVYT